MCRIAVIEDHADIRELLTLVLESVAGYEVIVFSDPTQVVPRLAAGEAFDLIISDITMPNMTGIEFVRYVRNKLQQTTLPIIAASAHLLDATQDATIEAGFDAYVTKPINIANLLTIVAKYVNKQDLAA